MNDGISLGISNIIPNLNTFKVHPSQSKSSSACNSEQVHASWWQNKAQFEIAALNLQGLQSSPFGHAVQFHVYLQSPRNHTVSWLIHQKDGVSRCVREDRSDHNNTRSLE